MEGHVNSDVKVFLKCDVHVQILNTFYKYLQLIQFTSDSYNVVHCIIPASVCNF
jgi:hypothetical protein